MTGRVFWMYRYTPAQDRIVCCGANNRGLAILGNTLFMGTLDAQLIAIDARSGRPIWKTEVATTKDGYSITHAPLVVKDKVIVGVGGGEYGIRGFIAAYDAATGKEAWRFYTIPAPGEPGSETWQACPKGANTFCDPDAWKHGGGSIWMTGSYDPQLNLTYWGVGNVGPDYNGAQRPGDNLYTDSVVALDADTGKLKWHYQFTPHDVYDYDSVQVPVLIDNWDGSRTNVVAWANRNGNFYVLDRATGRFLVGEPFVKVNWMSGFDERGRPMQTPQPAGQPTYPGNQGGDELVLAVVQPAHRPVLHLGLGRLREHLCARAVGVQGRHELRRRRPAEPVGSAGCARARPVADQHMDRGGRSRRGHRARSRERAREVEVQDDRRHRQRHPDDGSDLLFTGGREGFFQALDARTGALLWKTQLGASINSGPITYRVGTRQYVSDRVRPLAVRVRARRIEETGMYAVARRSMLALVVIALIGGAAGLRADDPLASPESVGFSADGLKAFQRTMRALVDDGKLAGVTTLVARHGKVVYFDAYGVQDLATKKPVARDTIFRLASMTKPIVGVAMMMLWEQGKWTLDDPVAKHIPEFAGLKVATPNGEVPQTKPMTMRQLMSHTAGFDVNAGYAKANLADRDQPLQANDRQAG